MKHQPLCKECSIEVTGGFWGEDIGAICSRCNREIKNKPEKERIDIGGWDLEDTITKKSRTLTIQDFRDILLFLNTLLLFLLFIMVGLGAE